MRCHGILLRAFDEGILIPVQSIPVWCLQERLCYSDMKWAGPKIPGQNGFCGNQEHAPPQLTVVFCWKVSPSVVTLEPSGAVCSYFFFRRHTMACVCIAWFLTGRTMSSQSTCSDSCPALVVVSRIKWRAWFVFLLLQCIQRWLRWAFC